MLLLLLIVAGAVVLSTLATTRGGIVTAGEACLVLHRERARGVHPQLQQLLDVWAREGTHNIVIAGGTVGGVPYVGGLRTQADQDAAAARGLTNAPALKDTPHGRGAALDVWPEGFDPARGFTTQPEMLKRCDDFGAFAVRYGFVSGKGFNMTAPDGTRGDRVHVELPNWRALPFPPPDYGGAA